MFFHKIEIPPSYLLIDNPKKLSWLSHELRTVGELAVDIETNHPTGKSKKKPENFVEKVAGVSFAWGSNTDGNKWKPGNAAYVPLVRQNDSEFWNDKHQAVISVLDEILSSDSSKVMHNGKFDVFKLCKLSGVKVKNFKFCTYLAHTLIDEARLYSSHALKSEYDKNGKEIKIGVANHYLDIEGSVFKTGLEEAMDFYDPSYRRYSKVPLDILYPYGCADADMTLALKPIFQKLIEQENMTWLYNNLIMPLQHQLTMMELHGVPLDISRAEQIRDEQLRLMDEYSQQIYEMVGKKFNIGSDQQLGSVLFEQLGLPGGQRTEHGWSTEAEVLSGIDHQIIPPILKWKRAEKIYGSFAVPALEAVDEVTDEGKVGWVHVTIGMDTVTGRLNTSDPNLSALPRPENGGKIVKSMWYGGEEYRFVFKDFSQIELRMIAHCSGEQLWIDSFHKGYDMHSAMAHRIWNLPCTVEEVKKKFPDKRSGAKAVNFGIAFGKSEYSLANDLGISVEEANKMINEEYFGAAPTLKGWIEYMHNFAEEKGYVYNIFGRTRHLPDAQLEVPDGVQWPSRDTRPRCYRNAPSMVELGIDPKDMYDITESQLKQLTKQNANNRHQYCAECSLLGNCFVNTVVKELSSRKGKAMRQSVNAPIQGGAVDMASLALIWIGKELLENRLQASPILHIHDELCVYCHTSCVEQVDRIMEDCMTKRMEKFTNFRVPLVVDTAIVPRWSEKHDKE